ncbi:MAG: hypothetical protein ACLFVP_03455 [Candidatus Bathyarchaeia archaeon]
MKSEKISGLNIENLRAIRGIIEVEDGREVTLNQALERVLDFYKKYVPYN